MPRLTDNMETGTIGGMQSFQFSSTRIEHLGATEYTLATIAVDETGSVAGFADELRNSLAIAVESCKKSPRSDNLLVRVIKFSTAFPNGVEEIHGFKPLSEIDPNKDYPALRPAGQTPLYDAVFSAVGATVAYGEKLMVNDFLANGIVFIITDGDEYPRPPNNPSTATPEMIKDEVGKTVTGEKLESLTTILIGINTAQCSSILAEFKEKAGISQYIDAGEASKGKLAKLAAFVSQSTSSQSQAIGTGGPSQNIPAKI